MLNLFYSDQFLKYFKVRNLSPIEFNSHEQVKCRIQRERKLTLVVLLTISIKITNLRSKKKKRVISII